MAKQWDVISRRYVDIPDTIQSGINSLKRVVNAQNNTPNFYTPPPPPPKPTEFKAASTNKEIADLVNSIFGGGGNTKYQSITNQAYQALGQPAQELPNENRKQLANWLVNDYAVNFVDKYYEKAKKLPTPQQVTDFVANSVDIPTAAGYIQGTVDVNDIKRNVDTYLKENPDIIGGTTSEDANQSQYRKALTTNLADLINQYQYIPERKQRVNDLIGRELLLSPISQYSLDTAEANKARSLTEGAGDIEKTIQNIRQEELNRALNAAQFNKQFGLAKEENFFNRALQNRQLDLAAQLGKLQANANKKSVWDKVATGLGIAKGVGDVATAGFNIANMA